MTTLNLKISGMHCDSCAKIITLGLKEVAGVERVEVDQKSKLARVSFDEKIINQQAILTTIENSGYKGELDE